MWLFFFIQLKLYIFYFQQLNNLEFFTDDASSPNEVNKIDEELNSDNNIVTNPTIESDIDNEAVTSENTANYAESEQNFDADEYTNSAEDPIEAKNIEESYDENSVTNQDENGSENNESVAIELEKNDEDNTTTDISNENELDNAKDDQCSEDKLDKDHSDNESENKKQTEDNEMGPDFECSDFKEHVPSDDKPDHNDKSTHEEVSIRKCIIASLYFRELVSLFNYYLHCILYC